MPNSNSAKKRVRQDAKRRLANRSTASSMKTAIRRVEKLVAAGDAPGVKTALSLAYKRIDKAAKVHIIHANTAARRKALVARHAAKVTGA